MPKFVSTAPTLVYQNPGRTADEIAQLAVDLGCLSRATMVSPRTSFSTTLSQYVQKGRWPDITREKGPDGVYRYYPPSTIAPPTKGAATPPRSMVDQDMAQLLVLTPNPYNPDYVINGCPIHSFSTRWVHKTIFYKDDTFWVCETCDDAYSDEQVAEVQKRDQIAEALDIINWPIKYAWAGEYPLDCGDSLECPICGSPKTSFGTISETGKLSSRPIMRWKCHKCATIFDLLDVPEYWAYVQKPDPLTEYAKQAELEAAWAEEARLAELYGYDTDEETEWPTHRTPHTDSVSWPRRA